MIEGKHHRSIEARRRSLGDAVDRYIREEVPRKRDGEMHTRTLTWWKAKIGTLKLADITPANRIRLRPALAGTAVEAKRVTLLVKITNRFEREGGNCSVYRPYQPAIDRSRVAGGPPTIT
jgi:hypothetical protein